MYTDRGGEKMEYSTRELAKLSGVSARTLRYYDDIGLLKPLRVEASGERIYGAGEVDRLQQILFYRALEVPRKDIAALLREGYDREAALREHLQALTAERSRLELLIGNVTKTLSSLKGETTMQDSEKFAGFKRRLVEENEEKYGAEARKNYGDEAMDESNKKMMGMSEEKYKAYEELTGRLNDALREAVKTGNPRGAEARAACEMHKEWLGYTWTKYTPAMHKGVAALYTQDERFRQYYEDIAPGAAQFLFDALVAYLG